MSTKAGAARIVALCVLSALLAACAEPSPEERIRELVAETERAAEAKDTGAILNVIAEDFSGARGEDRPQVERVLRATFFRADSIHLHTIVRGLELREPGQARARILVAMAGRAVESSDELRELRADLYEFDLELVERDGVWQVSGGSWRAARLDDFF